MSESDPILLVSRRLPEWQNVPETLSQPIKQLVDVWNAQPAESSFPSYLATTRTIQQLIGHAINHGDSIRALGAGWSFSPVAATDGILVNTKPLNYRFVVGNQVQSQYRGDPANLLFAQCGMSMAELNKHLTSKGKSLKTTGVINGQTIAGALSTGTHGAAIDIGAIQDYVVGLHIIIAPDRHVWLERATYPVIALSLPASMGAELVRDDELFNAALVGFGSFGIIHGVMLEVENLFYLHASRKRLPLDEALWWAADTLDFSGLALPRSRNQRPYHFEIMINPHDAAGGAYVTVMYKDASLARDCAPTRPDTIPQGRSALEFLGLITDVEPSVTRSTVNQLVQDAYTEYEGICGTLDEMFPTTAIRGRVASTALGIPLGRVREAIEMALRVSEEFPGLLTLRYVKASDATLAFTRHQAHTCVLELDAPQSERTMAFYRRVWRHYEDAGIPYTFHWGKLNDLNAERLRNMYGVQRIDAWRAARRTLLGPSGSKAFTNQFLSDVGLDG